MTDRRKIVARDFNTSPAHTVQFCCGTTCDAQANLEYVQRLELTVATYEQDIDALKRTIRLLRRKYEPTKGDTAGAT